MSPAAREHRKGRGRMKQPHPGVATLVAALCFLLLTACSGVPANLESAQNPSAPTQAWTDYVASLDADDVGPYRLLAGEWIDSENGFRLGVEARHYVLDDTVRFVTVHQDLAKRAEPAGGMSLTLLLDEGEGARTQLAAMHVPGDLSSMQLSSTGALLASQPAARPAHSAAGLDNCAILAIDYVSDSYFDRELKACHS